MVFFSKFEFVAGYPLWWTVTRNSFRRVCRAGGVVSDYDADFVVIFLVIEVLMGVCEFGVNICDNLAILIFDEDV